MTTPQPPTSSDAAVLAQPHAKESSGAGWYVGQQVRCVAAIGCDSLVVGKTYQVKRVTRDIELGTFLTIEGGAWPFCATRFEPVEVPDV